MCGFISVFLVLGSLVSGALHLCGFFTFLLFLTFSDAPVDSCLSDLFVLN